MGDQVQPRREFIQKHALDVRNLDVGSDAQLIEIGRAGVISL
jgi:hypothetical protein